AAPIALLSLTAATSAQVGVEGFETGNPDAWEIWFSAYNAVEPTGGNPGAYLELDNLNTGPLTCQFLEIFPDPSGTAFLHSGNWRAAGVDSVSIDIDIQDGIWLGDLALELVSDPGTPGNPNDDCVVRLDLPAVGAATPGWTTYTFPVPAGQTTMPVGWEIDPSSSCSNVQPDNAWNSVMLDVDRMRFVYDGDPTVFCAFTRWIFGVDNIAVNGTGTSIGSNYCTPTPNSLGVPAQMSAAGSAVVADNDVTISCGPMQNNAFGFFLTSRTQGLVMNPGGSDGDLCLGGLIGRYVGPGQVQNSGQTGVISLAIDLMNHPTPMGLVAVQPGETWHFTAWYRDIGGAPPSSNFGDGYTIVFQ
ncbi:MAG: hypothetical protein AAGA55_10690, partial [Planctomycetota bacterium]